MAPYNLIQGNVIYPYIKHTSTINEKCCAQAKLLSHRFDLASGGSLSVFYIDIKAKQLNHLSRIRLGIGTAPTTPHHPATRHIIGTLTTRFYSDASEGTYCVGIRQADQIILSTLNNTTESEAKIFALLSAMNLYVTQTILEMDHLAPSTPNAKLGTVIPLHRKNLAH